jgi:hypothetical protein
MIPLTCLNKGTRNENTLYSSDIQGVIMSLAELQMQPTIHLQSKPGYGRGKYSALHCKCIVGCIFSYIGLIITRESPVCAISCTT